MALRHHAGPGEGRQSIQAEVERIQALPEEAKVPPAAAVAGARSRSRVKRARRAVAPAGILMLATTLAFAFWYVPRHAVPISTSPPLQGSAVSLPPPPEKRIAPAPPVGKPMAARDEGEARILPAAMTRLPGSGQTKWRDPRSTPTSR